MTIHIASINNLSSLPSDKAALARDGVVKQMADHLVAGIKGGLRTDRDQDVIKYLIDAPERYHWRFVLDHMDAAIYEAKQTLIAIEMSDRA